MRLKGLAIATIAGGEVIFDRQREAAVQ